MYSPSSSLEYSSACQLGTTSCCLSRCQKAFNPHQYDFMGGRIKHLPAGCAFVIDSAK